jgi:hypothetical protein
MAAGSNHWSATRPRRVACCRLSASLGNHGDHGAPPGIIDEGQLPVELSHRGSDHPHAKAGGGGGGIVTRRQPYAFV